MSEFIAYLQKALNAKHGLVLACAEPQRLIQKLHQARKEAQVPAFETLIIAVSRDDPHGEVWLVRKDVPFDRPETTEQVNGPSE